MSIKEIIKSICKKIKCKCSCKCFTDCEVKLGRKSTIIDKNNLNNINETQNITSNENTNINTINITTPNQQRRELPRIPNIYTQLE